MADLMVTERYQLYATEITDDVGFVTASLDLGVSVLTSVCEDLVGMLAALRHAIGEIGYEVAYSMSRFGDELRHRFLR